MIDGVLGGTVVMMHHVDAIVFAGAVIKGVSKQVVEALQFNATLLTKHLGELK